MNKDVHRTQPYFTSPRKDSERGWIEESASFEDLNHLAFQFQFALQSEGTAAGARILIHIENQIECFALKMACESLGAAPVILPKETKGFVLLKTAKILKPYAIVASKQAHRWTWLLDVPKRFSIGNNGFAAKDIRKLFPGVIQAPLVTTIAPNFDGELELTWDFSEALKNLENGKRTVLPAVSDFEKFDFEPAVILDQIRRHGVTSVRAPAMVVDRIGHYLYAQGLNLPTVTSVSLTSGKLSSKIERAFSILFPRSSPL